MILFSSVASSAPAIYRAIASVSRFPGLMSDVDRADVRVIETRDCPSFAIEAVAELRIGGQARRQHVDRDGTIEARVTSFIDLAHAAGAERRLDFVWTKSRAG